MVFLFFTFSKSSLYLKLSFLNKMNSQKFEIIGKKPLKGNIIVSGSKNAALPCIAAAILGNTPTILKNVPKIDDVLILLKILEHLDAKISWDKNTVTIDPRKMINKTLPGNLVQSLRASILLLGPLLSRFGEVKMAFPGGCLIGKRSIRAHINAFRDLGAEIKETQGEIHLKLKKAKSTKIVLWEISVTATENILIACAAQDETNYISLAAFEPHVQDLCEMLKKMGAKISGIGTSTIKITGTKKLKGITHTLSGDYLEMGIFAVAGATTPGSKIQISGIDTSFLDAFWNKFREAGVNFNLIGKDQVEVSYTKNLVAFPKLDTRIYPGFPTDLQAPFSIILTQSKGVSRIFETLFESRLNYLFELEKMGAKVEVYNPHQALIVGPTPLKGNFVESCDLRAGATLVLAGLIAEGTTNIFNINYIDRGHEKLEEKLQNLGAEILRKSL